MTSVLEQQRENEYTCCNCIPTMCSPLWLAFQGFAKTFGRCFYSEREREQSLWSSAVCTQMICSDDSRMFVSQEKSRPSLL